MNMPERETVSFDRPTLNRFKKAYAKAPDDKDASFTFDGREYVKAFAKYLIEYLESQLPKE
jgi:hypothetical protein